LRPSWLCCVCAVVRECVMFYFCFKQTAGIAHNRSFINCGFLASITSIKGPPAEFPASAQQCFLMFLEVSIENWMLSTVSVERRQ
jgi:hypothetical protein